MTLANKDIRPELMMKMFENSTEAIFFFNREGEMIAHNPAAEKIVDLNVSGQLQQGAEKAICTACRGYTSETEYRTCVDCFLTSKDKDAFTSFQVHLETAEKGVVPYAATFHTIDPQQGIRVFMLRDLTNQFKTQQKLHQNLMMKHVIQAQENERKRISRELHDSVAQELMSAVIELRALKYMTNDTNLLVKTDDTKATLTRLLDDIRNMSVELRPAALDDFGLEAAFRSHFKRMENSFGMDIEFHSDIKKKRYGGELETVFYRVGQEAVLNAMKYAGVDKLQVYLFEKGGALQLIVKDDGEGFSPGGLPEGTGLGLFGMNERAELVDGNVQIQSAPGKGTTVHLRVPM